VRGNPAAATAGSELARERLAAYARFAELVSAQESALQAGDMDRFRTLTAAAEELRSACDLALPDAWGQRLADGSRTFHESAGEILSAALATSERIQTRLLSLQRETGVEIRRMSAERARGRAYLEGSGTSASPGVHLDVRT
jgi:hypothetical protein